MPKDETYQLTRDLLIGAAMLFPGAAQTRGEALPRFQAIFAMAGASVPRDPADREFAPEAAASAGKPA